MGNGPELNRTIGDVRVSTTQNTDAVEGKGVVNPFSVVKSGYGRLVDGKFQSVYPPGTPAHDFHISAQQYIDGLISDKRFPCVFGQAAVRTEQYSLSAYDDITDPAVAEGVLHDLVRFQEEFEIPAKKVGARGIFRSALVAFREPEITDDWHGVEVLYTLLQNMHGINSEHYEWTEGYSNDLNSSDFGYSAGESAHFLAFFYRNASVPARRSDVQFIVFNSHHVIAAYKEIKGMEHHARMRAVIRGRQVQPIHPYLGNHGDVPEWRQYTLLEPTPEAEARELGLREKILGSCPFQPKAK